MKKREPLHIHFDSRRAANPVFHMTKALCAAALARQRGLAKKVRMTFGWDLEGATEAFRTADAFVGFRIPKEVVRDAAPHLKMIHLIGAGVEHLRPLDWVPKKVSITNNKGIHTQKAGEFILLSILMLNNRIPTLVNFQAKRHWEQLFTGQVKGKTVLIVGAGHLGNAGARELRRIGLNVIGINRSGRAHRLYDEMYTPKALQKQLPRADFVLITVPSTAQTDGMIGEKEFGLMKKGAGFINFSRAKVCDYDALVKTLNAGKLSGAILDVFDPEPLPADSNLWTVPNLLITPHCSSDDADLYIPMTLDLVFENVAKILGKKPLKNKVVIEREY